MKTVFSNSQLTHVWAQQSQQSGRSGSMHFDGPTLYSYETPIARFVDCRDGGQRVCLVTSHSYSVTTNGKHINAATRALRNTSRLFYVPDVGTSGGRARSARAFMHGSWSEWKKVHLVNLAHLVQVFKDAAATEFRRVKWDDPSDGAERLANCHRTVTDYCIAFRLKMPALDMPAHMEKIRAKRERIANDPKRQARLAAGAAARERAQARRDEQMRAQAILDASRKADNLAAWLRGETMRSWDLPRGDSAWLRVLPGLDVVQTSWGADVPITDARRLLTIVRGVRAAGTDWGATAREITVGHFSVRKIAANGDLEIGCHTIKWPAVERIIPALEVQP